MTPEDVLQLLRRRPFVPFLIHVDDGTTFEVRHPELVMVGLTTLFVGFPVPGRDGVVQRTEFVSLFHITLLEPLQASPTTS